MKNPFLARAAVILAIALFILVPISQISGKVTERQARAAGVMQQFADETSGSQTIVGPLLVATCEETYLRDREGARAGQQETLSEKAVRSCPAVFFVPRKLLATATMGVDTRHRGIYPIRAFQAHIDLDAQFAWPAQPEPLNGNTRAWKDVYVGYFVSDPRGIQAFTGTGLPLADAVDSNADLGKFTLRESLGPYPARKPGTELSVAAKLDLVGTTLFDIAPVGDQSEIRIESRWPHPSFTKAWSPSERRIAADGFSATWRVSAIATGGRSMWSSLAANGKLANAKAAGVALADPVDIYALSYRATQYAFLFVLFTFSALALAEALGDVRIHPVHYLLVGCAVAVFFLLLIALSEHIAFGAAYASGASACVLLLTFYLRHTLGTRARTAMFFGLFAGLYAALYALLLSEDNALLMGSLMVFALLAVAMIGTRKKDWDAIARGMGPGRLSPRADPPPIGSAPA